MNKMEAIIFKDTGRFEYVQKEIPTIRDGHDVKIKILAAGICGSDVHILADPPGIRATKGAILGHECVAEVEETGPDVTTVAEGDRIILDNNLTCGVCPACRTGHPNMCRNMKSMGSQIDGIFCEYSVVPERAVMKIPMNVDIRKAVLSEPLDCAVSAIKKLRIVPGCTCVVLGGGPLGMMFAGFLKKAGAGKVVISEPNEKRSQFARKSGADVLLNPMTDNLDQVVSDLTEGIGADIVIDAVGSLMKDAVRLVKPTGTVLLFGLNARSETKIRQYSITVKDITILGNYIAYHSLPDVVNILKSDMIDFTWMITHEFPLRKFGEGLEAIRRGDAMKVVLYPGK